MKSRAEQLAQRMQDLGVALAPQVIDGVVDGDVVGPTPWAQLPADYQALAVAVLEQLLGEFTDLPADLESGELPSTMRRFLLRRFEDETGMSGIGDVAEGAVFTDGTAVMRWRTEVASTAVYPDVTAVETIHGHGGRTRIVMVD